MATAPSTFPPTFEDLRSKIVGHRSSLAVLAGIVALGPFALLDFDLHHDGYMLAGAVALSDGGIVQNSAFMQYGPLFPALQSAALRMPTQPTVALRILSLLIVLLTVAILARSGAGDPRWPVSHPGAFVGTLGWLLLADQPLMNIPFLPWVSGLMAFLLALSLWLAKHAVISTWGTKFSSLFALGSGSVAGVLLFVRPQVFLIVLAGSVTLAFVGASAELRLMNQQFVIGSLTVVAFGVAVLARYGALEDWFRQAILYPFGFFVREAPLFVESGGVAGALRHWFFAAGTALALVWASIRIFSLDATNLGAGRWRLRWALLAYVAISGTVAVDVILGIGPAQSHLRGLFWSPVDVFPWQGWILVLGLTIVIALAIVVERRFASLQLAVQSNQTLSIGIFAVPVLLMLLYPVDVRLLVSSVGALLAVVVGTLSFFARGRMATFTPFLAVFAVAGFSEALSTGSSRHFWYGMPFALLLIAHLVVRLDFVQRPLVFVLSGALVIIGVQVAGDGARALSEPRVRLENAGPATGVYGVRDRAILSSPEALVEAVHFLEQQLGADGRAIFLVDDGFFSVATGRYASIDAWFVRWGPVPPLRDRLPMADLVITDGEGCKECTELGELGWHITGKSSSLAAWRRASA